MPPPSAHAAALTNWYVTVCEWTLHKNAPFAAWQVVKLMTCLHHITYNVFIRTKVSIQFCGVFNWSLKASEKTFFFLKKIKIVAIWGHPHLTHWIQSVIPQSWPTGFTLHQITTVFRCCSVAACSYIGLTWCWAALGCGSESTHGLRQEPMSAWTHARIHWGRSSRRGCRDTWQHWEYCLRVTYFPTSSMTGAGHSRKVFSTPAGFSSAKQNDE